VSLFIDHILAPDVHANRPVGTSTPAGAVFPCTTHATLDRWDGASWATWGTLAGGGAPALHAATHAAAGTDPVALDDSQIAPVAPNDQTGTTYTFVLADKHRLVTGNNAVAQTFTIPPNSSVAYPLGAAVMVYQKGAGQVTVAPGAGVTLRTPHGAKTSVQYAVVTAIQVVTDTWVVTGDTTT
jgi:hypothetical protein